MRRLPLGAIVLLGLFLRIKDIDSNPPELFEDEISGAISAWSAVTTGHDLIADHFPLFTTYLGAQLPTYGLLTVPFQAVLGHTILAVRLPAVLLGVAAIVLLYAVVRALGGGRTVALLSAAVIAVLPWAVQFGRIGWDNASYPPLLLAGLLLLLRALDGRPEREGRARWWLVSAAAVLALTAYTYQIAIVMTPLFVAPVLWARRERVARLDPLVLVAGVAIAAAIVAPYLWTFATVPDFRSRTDEIATFATGVRGATLERFVVNYAANLSPTFLFVSGDRNLRHGTGQGELLLWMLPFALIGIGWSIRHLRRSAVAVVALAWLLAAPLPAALTNDGVPHAARSMLELLAWPVLTAIGTRAAWAVRLPRRRLVQPLAAIGLVVIVLVVVTETATYYRAMFTTYPLASAHAWRSGTAATMREVAARTPAGGHVCIGTLSRFTVPHVSRWYLGDAPAFSVFESNGSRCPDSGDIIALPADDSRPAHSTEVATVRDRAGALVARIWRRDAP
ncbi:MAG TPA: glycosyltransferase family 39 protein [Candidatus Saccharimonadales bacterium]|nr:glycosyltransferase family 39 protein [Candidatus Saccharimonadales bacterium]